MAPPVWEILDPLLIRSNILTFHNFIFTQEQAIKTNKSGYKIVQVKINEDPLEGVKRIDEVRSILDKDTILLVDANTGEKVHILICLNISLGITYLYYYYPFEAPMNAESVNLTLNIFKLQPFLTKDPLLGMPLERILVINE